MGFTENISSKKNWLVRFWKEEATAVLWIKNTPTQLRTSDYLLFLQDQLLLLDGWACRSSRISWHTETLWRILRPICEITGMYFNLTHFFRGLLLCYHCPFFPLGLGISYVKFLEESWGMLHYNRKPLGWLHKQTTHNQPSPNAAWSESSYCNIFQ